MRPYRWANAFLGLLLLIGLLAPVLACDRPLVALVGGKLRFPAFGRQPIGTDWQDRAVDWAIWPPIPHAAGTADLSTPALLPPLARSASGYHWLGTDRLGRDTAAGLVAGTRIAVCVGVGSLFIALLIGVPLGAVAGFYGNSGIQLSRAGVLALGLGGVLGATFALGSLAALGPGLLLLLLLVGLSVAASTSLVWLPLRALASRISWLQRPVIIPVDRLVLLLMELNVSIPGLVVLIAVLSFTTQSSLLLMVVIIGVLGWTQVARFLRAELIRIREMRYVAAARISGIGELRVLFRHALPNAVRPVLVVASFMVGSSILAETMLSFLGVGVSAAEVTWGSMLQQSRTWPSAWWLAVFPGILLTLTVLACNSTRRR